MKPNSTKAKLKAGGSVYGVFVRYPDPSLIEVIGYQGWDYIVFDAEHGTIDPRDCENMVRAAELRGVTPIVRVTTNAQPIILRFMDVGTQGVLVPWVNSAADAESAVRSVKYFPRGIRGVAGVRAADYSQGVPISDYVGVANAETLVALQVETKLAVEHLDEIVAVKDIDVIFIGPNDLAHSLGLPGKLQHPEVEQAMNRISETVLKAGIALGIMVWNVEGARQWRDRGARFISIGLESILGPAARDYLAGARK